MEKIEVENNKYELIVNYKDAFDKEEFINNAAKLISELHYMID